MFQLQHLIKQNMDKLGGLITTELGKTQVDAKGDVLRGLRTFMTINNRDNYHILEVVEHACSITSLQMGEIVDTVSTDMDTYSLREPLGVCAGITPFNFPAMIPLWVSNLTHEYISEVFRCSHWRLFVEIPMLLSRVKEIREQ
jgi:malonate-semialdehyde dehydrogenase (acetylating)/methylmalonate-semialdehyde dehydrogenase